MAEQPSPQDGVVTPAVRGGNQDEVVAGVVDAHLFNTPNTRRRLFANSAERDNDNVHHDVANTSSVDSSPRSPSYLDFAAVKTTELLYFDMALARDGVHGGSEGAIYRSIAKSLFT